MGMRSCREQERSGRRKWQKMARCNSQQQEREQDMGVKIAREFTRARVKIARGTDGGRERRPSQTNSIDACTHACACMHTRAHAHNMYLCALSRGSVRCCSEVSSYCILEHLMDAHERGGSLVCQHLPYNVTSACVSSLRQMSRRVIARGSSFQTFRSVHDSGLLPAQRPLASIATVFSIHITIATTPKGSEAASISTAPPRTIYTALPDTSTGTAESIQGSPSHTGGTSLHEGERRVLCVYCTAPHV